MYMYLDATADRAFNKIILMKFPNLNLIELSTTTDWHTCICICIIVYIRTVIILLAEDIWRSCRPTLSIFNFLGENTEHSNVIMKKL